MYAIRSYYETPGAFLISPVKIDNILQWPLIHIIFQIIENNREHSVPVGVGQEGIMRRYYYVIKIP